MEVCCGNGWIWVVLGGFCFWIMSVGLFVRSLVMIKFVVCVLLIWRCLMSGVLS